MKKIYLKFFRKSYRMLRHPRIKKFKWLNSIVVKLYARKYWKPCVHSIAVGLSIGLFCSMLTPMPMQMLLAAVCCILGKGNIPIAVAACWITNPFTQLPIMFLQEKLGNAVRSRIDLGLLEKIDLEGTIPFTQHNVNLANYTLGVILSAICLGLLAYPLVYLIQALTPKHKRLPAPVKEVKNSVK